MLLLLLYDLTNCWSSRRRRSPTALLPTTSVVSRGSVSDSYTYIYISPLRVYIYICMRGNRRTKNTFVAVESRSLTESDGWRVRAANPRFLPTTRDRPELAASSTSPPAAPHSGSRRRPTIRRGGPHPGAMVGRRVRGNARSPPVPCHHHLRRRRHRNASRRPPVILPWIVKHA